MLLVDSFIFKFLTPVENFIKNFVFNIYHMFSSRASRATSVVSSVKNS